MYSGLDGGSVSHTSRFSHLAHLVWTSERKVLLRVTSVRIGIVACVYVMSSSIPSVFHIVTTQWTYCGQLLSDVFLSLTIAIAIAAPGELHLQRGPALTYTASFVYAICAYHIEALDLPTAPYLSTFKP